MITKIKEADAASLSPSEIADYLESTDQVNILYRNRSVLEISKFTDVTAEAAQASAYRVVYKHYDPLGCCDDWTVIGVGNFDLSGKDEAITCFLERFRNPPDE